MDGRTKKVMFVTGGLTDGGAERVIGILASQCAEMGAEVTLVILREKERAYQISDQVQCVQIKAGNGKLKGIKRIIELHRIKKNSTATTVIPFLPIISLYTLASNIGVGKRVILSERADPGTKLFAKNLSKKDILGNFLTRKLGFFHLADWMVFQTPDAQAYFGRRLREKSCIIPNPLDTEHLPARYTGIREKCIVAAGRFSHEKNFPMLFQAFAQFHKGHPDYRLLLFGDGCLRETYTKMIRELGIAEYVEMPGFVKDLTEQMNRKAMYVSTSDHEGISNSMLEALGMGVPTIVTDCPVGGARMFVENDVNGILIPMGDAEALTRAMNKIADESGYADAISMRATEIRERISAKKICRQWLALVS